MNNIEIIYNVYMCSQSQCVIIQNHTILFDKQNQRETYGII